jgi:hypothetical protein
MDRTPNVQGHSFTAGLPLANFNFSFQRWLARGRPRRRERDKLLAVLKLWQEMATDARKKLQCGTGPMQGERNRKTLEGVF